MEKKVRLIKVALAGNPNVGKSVIFNELTGGRAWIGNWPGVTVEKKVGKFKVNNIEVEVTDLPGIYSLTAYTIDELIARNFIVEENPHVVVDIINATNLERNLYLTISLLEMGANVVIALNMIDLAKKEGYEVDHERLSQILKVPVVPTIAIKGYGINELKKTIIKSALKIKRKEEKVVDYGNIVESKINELIKLLSQDEELALKYSLRWLAIKLLENDKDVIKRIKLSKYGKTILEQVQKIRESLSKELGKDVEEYLIEKRYEFISKVVSEVVRVVEVKPISLTDVIDFTVTHKIFGIPIALSFLYFMFRFAFEVSEPLTNLIDWFFGTFLYELVSSAPLNPLIKSILADVLVTGIGSILVFLPVISFFFITLALLEDIGYMARVAFLIDKIMHKFGLSGKSIIPMIIGIGCNVPAIMATRPIEDENDRKVTGLVAPLISCSARLPVYLLIAGAIFRGYETSVVFSMYVLGIILALLMASFFRKLIFKGPSVGFIMELPPYMKPLLKNVCIKTWERTKRFLIKAGTVILAGVFIVWILSITGPKGYLGVEALTNPKLLEKSWVGVIGHFLEIVFSPMGWDWRASVALFFGFIAKEIVVGSLSMLYGIEEEALGNVIAKSFTPVSAYAYMVFVLTYVPCLATLATIRSEFGVKYALLALLYEVVLAYILALIITFIGGIMGL